MARPLQHVDWAVAYARFGWPVFPLRAASKHPLLDGGFLRATRDVATIRGWWRRWPDASIGVATGVAFDAIDFDNAEALERFTARSPLAGPVNRTPHGFHLLVARSGLRNTRGVLPGTDFRGLGGLIIVPPSIHECGERYAWEQSPRTPLLPMPEWFRGELTAKPLAEAIPQLIRSGTLAKATGIAHVMAAEGHPLGPLSTYKWWRCGMHESHRNSLLIFPTEDVYRCLTCDQYGPAQELYTKYNADQSRYWDGFVAENFASV